MSQQAGPLWDIQPHTKVKHEILNRYLDAWFPILAKYNQRIVYLDGFCGPGRYKGGEDGSPIIAIKKALNHFNLLQNREISFIFIDEEKEHINHLVNEITSMNIPSNFLIHTDVSEFEKTVQEVLNNLKTNNLSLAPTFAFIDPFGFKGIPFSLVKELLGNEETEVFINVMVESINRFIEHPDANVRQHILDLFGTNQVLQAITNNGNRVEALRRLYQTQLESCAKYVCYFEMYDQRGRLIYYLFFASNHPLGFVRMKESFWKADPKTGFHFSGKDDSGQLVLFPANPAQELEKIIAQKFLGQTIIVAKIQKYIEEKTSYISKHMREALGLMEAGGKITVSPLKSDGTKRTRGFPEKAIVKFL